MLFNTFFIPMRGNQLSMSSMRLFPETRFMNNSQHQIQRLSHTRQQCNLPSLIQTLTVIKTYSFLHFSEGSFFFWNEMRFKLLFVNDGTFWFYVLKFCKSNLSICNLVVVRQKTFLNSTFWLSMSSTFPLNG